MFRHFEHKRGRYNDRQCQDHRTLTQCLHGLDLAIQSFLETNLRRPSSLESIHNNALNQKIDTLLNNVEEGYHLPVLPTIISKSVVRQRREFHDQLSNTINQHNNNGRRQHELQQDERNGRRQHDLQRDERNVQQRGDAITFAIPNAWRIPDPSKYGQYFPPRKTSRNANDASCWKRDCFLQ